VLPVREGKNGTVPLDGSLARASWGHSENCNVIRAQKNSGWHFTGSRVAVPRFVLTISTLNGHQIQRLKMKLGASLLFAL